MTTVNLNSSPYNLVGDGQQVTAVLSITNGGTVLTSSTNLWSSGDVGKGIAFGPKGAAFGCKIASPFIDPQHVNLTVAYTGTTLTAASTLLEWGTDNAAGLIAFNGDYTGQTGAIEADLSAGRYVVGYGGQGASSVGFGFGIKNLRVVGSGTVIISDLLGTARGVFLGGCVAGQYADNLHHARTAAIAMGDTVIHLLNPSDSALFTVGGCGLQTGIDVQDDNQTPSNQDRYEIVDIVAINSVAGTITIQDPIRNSYKTTWPYFGYHGGTENGGPATLYALEPGWNCNHEYLFQLDQFGQTNSIGRNITFTGGSSTGYGIYPSRNDTFTVSDYTQTDHESEFDKITRLVTILRGTWHAIKFQSPSPDVFTMTDAVIDNLNGSPKKTVLSGCALTSATFGPVSFGACREIIADSCNFGSIGQGGITEVDIFGAGAWSLSGGVFSRAKTAGTGEPPQWGTPGCYCFIGGRYAWLATFRVIDIWDDATNVYVSTTLGSLAHIPGSVSTNEYSISTHPAPKLTWTNNSGCDQALAWNSTPAGAPAFSYWKLTYGDIGATKSALSITGKLRSARFTVPHAYTGANSPAFFLNDPFVLVRTDGSITTWTPHINLKVAGERLITPGQATTGTQSGDTGLADPGDIWLVLGQITPKVSASMSDDLATTVTLELVCDHLLASPSVSPMRLRLHL